MLSSEMTVSRTTSQALWRFHKISQQQERLNADKILSWVS